MLVKPTPLNINSGSDRLAMFNKQRDIPMTVLIGVWIGPAFGVAVVRAAEPSARSFGEAIYEHYKGKNGNGIALDNDAAV